MRARYDLLLLSVLALALPAVAGAETPIPVGSFRSVAVHNGLQVVLRHGTEPGVKLIHGSPDCVRVAIEGADRLVIERLVDKCPNVHDMVLEVTAPEVAALSVSDGGTLRSQGEFPRQQALQSAVANGGSLDVRALKADYVTAAVQSGGRIFARSDGSLLATIAQGGIITYWGNAKVQSSIAHGGTVTRGRQADANKPLEAFDLAGPPPVAPIPPVPATTSY